MRPITDKVKKILEADPRMKLCAVRHVSLVGACEGRVEWDHVWIYAGKQINEPWAIVGLCKKHHRNKDGNGYLKSLVQGISIRLATSEDLAKYPRKNWLQIKHFLGL